MELKANPISTQKKEEAEGKPAIDEEKLYKDQAGVLEMEFKEHYAKQLAKEGYGKENLAVSFWDVSSKYPTQICERRCEGQDTVDLIFSRCGKFITHVYY